MLDPAPPDCLQFRPLARLEYFNSAWTYLRLTLSGALLAGTALLAGPATAAAPGSWPAMDQVYADFIDIGHKQVPLPQGEWRVVAVADEAAPADSHPGPYGVIENIVLFRLGGEPGTKPQVNGFIVIHANALPVNGGWGTSRDCQVLNADRGKVYDESGHNLFCSFTAPVSLRRDPGAAPGWLQALTLAGARGWQVGERWVMAGFRISDRHDVVDVRYHFPDAPAVVDAPSGSPLAVLEQPLAWAQSLGETVVPSPQLKQVGAWVEQMREPVELGFRRRLDGELTLAEPGAEARPALAKGAGGISLIRLSDLDSLHEAGALNAKDYATLRRLVVGEPTPGEQADGRAEADKSADAAAGPSKLQLSMVKMMSWKLIGTTAGLTIKYLFIGNPMTVAGLQVIHSTMSAVLFVTYDMMWNSLVTRDAKPVIDFKTAAS